MVKQQKYELGQTLMLAVGDFQYRLDADLKFRGVVGIQARHRAVFIHLDRFGASRSVELATAAGIRPQSMMKIVHEMEQLGLVTRSADPCDSRAKLIEFTPAGQNLIEELTQSTEAVWGQYSQLVGEAELDRTLDSLKKLLLANKHGENQ